MPCGGQGPGAGPESWILGPGAWGRTRILSIHIYIYDTCAWTPNWVLSYILKPKQSGWKSISWDIEIVKATLGYFRPLLRTRTNPEMYSTGSWSRLIGGTPGYWNPGFRLLVTADPFRVTCHRCWWQLTLLGSPVKSCFAMAAGLRYLGLGT